MNGALTAWSTRRRIYIAIVYAHFVFPLVFSKSALLPHKKTREVERNIRFQCEWKVFGGSELIVVTYTINALIYTVRWRI